MSHSIAPIPVVTAYFDDPTATPVIEQEYRPGRGWITTGYRKRVSHAWLRRLQRDSVTAVALRYGDRLADFSMSELMRSHR